MKIMTAALAAIMGICLSSAAEAQGRRVTSYTYLFGEFNHYNFSRGGSLNGGGIGGGWRFTPNLAVQAGGQYAQDSGIDYYNGYLELLGIVPLSSSFSLYASIGAAYAQASTSVRIGATTVTVSTSGSGYRAGIGANYWLTKEWGIRAGFHRQNALNVGDDYGLGVTYRF